jgi:asparagine synthase (glutamine-hydrolysing)
LVGVALVCPDVSDVAGDLESSMSGICAVWRKDHPERIASTLLAVNAGLLLRADERSISHTAPEPGVGVAAQARSDAQQIYRNHRVLLACDTDLLNQAELATAAHARGDRQSTGAILATLYEQHGDRFVDKLSGGFAVVLWDLIERRLVAAIDGFGIKRLAWYEDGEVLLIASRADVLRAGTDRLTINPHAIANILNFSASLAPDTIFTGVKRLPPGMLLTAGSGNTRLESYWDMRYGTGTGVSAARLSRELEAVVEQSVAAHCGGETAAHLGAFLSGGTDSSTVVGLMTRTAGEPAKAFSIGFQEPGFNELEYADIAARRFGAEHHTYLVSATDCLESLTDIVRCFDEPCGNSSAIATYFCARLAAEHGVKTLLAGDGGDELFGGNEHYKTEKIFEAYHSIPTGLRTHLIEPLAGLPIDISLTRKARGYIRRANMRGVERILSFQFLSTHAAGDVFDADFLRSLGDYSVLDTPSRHYSLAPAREHLDRLLYVDMKITLADNDLPKVTCTSDLAGVRSRFPFLDRSVAEFAGRVPARLKVKGLQKRYLFKRAFRDLLPAEIVRKKKHGFGVPVAVWMKTDPRMRELAHDTLLSTRAAGRGYFRPGFIQDLLRRHETNDDNYYGDILWTFLMLELWHRRVVDETARAATA